ncbi:hypothetical protein BFJ68_g3783 [Fusarium oxysporum]|uniref:Uncharacterized protein n=1 Tax=Fusarium oxysporum TaxID=5507 RepID=A0A420RP25_FUSOX|nr:hypothetical protein FOXYS1_8774 [Fusarium oxysporum]RKL10329.1 hypothetical protein BFJ71_g679 [Fusarium oxysporum]RKL18760.1 hypothetical protein BFJ68_g3783 [Fusarium oxysporum]
MQDAVRPSEQRARRAFAQGYQTWSALHRISSEETDLWRDCLQRMRTAFPDHPRLPQNVKADKNFRNVALVKATTTWLAANEVDHLPPFKDESTFYVAWDKPTKMILTADGRHSSATLPDIFGKHSRHIPVLLQAWAYILSARWAELVPGAHLFRHDISLSNGNTSRSPPEHNSKSPVTINLGAVSEGAAQWWTALLSVERGWSATMSNKEGRCLHSPWSISLESEIPILISVKGKSTASASADVSTTLSEAYSYLAEYCSVHRIDDDVYLASLAGALMIPASKYDGRSIALPVPDAHWGEKMEEDRRQHQTSSTLMGINNVQFDRLLTLSCNAKGIKALLTSVFCGNDKTLREGRAGWWNIDLGAAAWTGTLMSFIQMPVPQFATDTRSISRADECRLLYLCHDINYTIPPLFPFPPFGSTAIEDTNIDVHEHILCGWDHSLRFSHLTWHCSDGTKVQQGPKVPSMATRLKNGVLQGSVPEEEVDYEEYDSEDENSEMVTRNIFTWLRGDDGFPVAERAIREHEWIDNLDSEDDEPIEGDVHSSFDGHLHGWLLETSTQRSNSI